MSDRKYNLTVVTEKGYDGYSNSTFIIEDDILVVVEHSMHFCYPLQNVLLYTFEETTDG